jgi:hypothetical protein
MTIVTAAVMADVADRSVHRYWSAHASTASVLAGLLVLLLTALVVDRVVRMREVRRQVRAIAAQAAVIVGQYGEPPFPWRRRSTPDSELL